MKEDYDFLKSNFEQTKSELNNIIIKNNDLIKKHDKMKD